MMLTAVLALLLFCCQGSSLPLPHEVLRDEKVTKCITEVLSDALSKPSPVAVSSECIKILKEDERMLEMLRHQQLLKELQELVKHEEVRESKRHFEDEEEEDEKRDEDWEEEEEEEGEESLEKRAMVGKKAAGGTARRRAAAEKKDGIVKREGDLEKIDREQWEEKEVINGGDDTKMVLHESQEQLSNEDKRNPHKLRSSLKEERNRSEEEEKEIEKLLEKMGKEKEEEEEDEEKRAAKMKKGHSGEEEEEEMEEEEGEFRKRSGKERKDFEKRVEENASDEETDQFEAEQKGIKFLDSQMHLHKARTRGAPQKKSQGAGKRWGEDEEEEEGDLEEDLWKRHHDPEEERVGEGRRAEEVEFENLAEIESELKKVAEKLREIRQG